MHFLAFRDIVTQPLLLERVNSVWELAFLLYGFIRSLLQGLYLLNVKTAHENSLIFSIVL